MNDTNEAERQAALRRLQSELFVFEGDIARIERKRGDVEIEIRRIKNSIVRLEADLSVQTAELTTLDRQLATAHEDMNRHKKKMNAL